MGLQVIYTNQVNVTGKWTPKDRAFKENPIEARRGQRDPVEENVLGLLNTGKKKKERTTEIAIQTKLSGESRRVKGNRPLLS